MIRARSTVLIVAAAVGCVVAAWVATALRAPSQGPTSARHGAHGAPEARGAFVPELAERSDAIDRVEIDRGATRFVLARSDDGAGWIAVDHADYPIDAERLRAILAAIARLERVEALTALPSRHAELGLAWPDDSGDATLVRLFDGDAPIAEIILGRTRFSPPTVYGRRLNEDQTWRCRGEVTIDANPIRMMNPVVLELPGHAIALIECEAESGSGPGSGSGLALLRDDAQQWVIEEDVDAAAGEANPLEPSPVKPSPDADARIEDARRAEILRILPELFTRLEFDAVRWASDPSIAPEHRITAQVGDRTVAVEILPEESETEADGDPTNPLAAPGRWFRLVVRAPEPGLGALAPEEAATLALKAAASGAEGREFRWPAWRSARILSILTDRR